MHWDLAAQKTAGDRQLTLKPRLTNADATSVTRQANTQVVSWIGGAEWLMLATIVRVGFFVTGQIRR